MEETGETDAALAGLAALLVAWPKLVSSSSLLLFPTLWSVTPLYLGLLGDCDSAVFVTRLSIWSVS